MIGRLRGLVAEIGEEDALIDVWLSEQIYKKHLGIT